MSTNKSSLIVTKSADTPGSPEEAQLERCRRERLREEEIRRIEEERLAEIISLCQLYNQQHEAEKQIKQNGNYQLNCIHI